MPGRFHHGDHFVTVFLKDNTSLQHWGYDTIFWQIKCRYKKMHWYNSTHDIKIIDTMFTTTTTGNITSHIMFEENIKNFQYCKIWYIRTIYPAQQKLKTKINSALMYSSNQIPLGYNNFFFFFFEKLGNNNIPYSSFCICPVSLSF